MKSSSIPKVLFTFLYLEGIFTHMHCVLLENCTVLLAFKQYTIVNDTHELQYIREKIITSEIEKQLFVALREVDL